MIEFHRYYILLACVLVSVIFFCWHLRRSPIGFWRIFIVILFSLIVSVIGSRLFAFFMRGDPISSLDWATLMSSGARHPGSIIALLLVMPLIFGMVIPKGWRLQMGDTLAMVLLLCVPIHRLVCHMNGCCLGSVCHEGYCLTFSVTSPVYMDQIRAGLIVSGVPQSLPVFPLHLFIAAGSALSFAVLFWFERYKAYAGQGVLLFLVLNEGMKAILETWREPFIVELQVASAALAAFGLFSLVLLGWYHRYRQNAVK